MTNHIRRRQSGNDFVRKRESGDYFHKKEARWWLITPERSVVLTSYIKKRQSGDWLHQKETEWWLVTSERGSVVIDHIRKRQSGDWLHQKEVVWWLITPERDRFETGYIRKRQSGDWLHQKETEWWLVTSERDRVVYPTIIVEPLCVSNSKPRFSAFFFSYYWPIHLAFSPENPSVFFVSSWQSKNRMKNWTKLKLIVHIARHFKFERDCAAMKPNDPERLEQ